MGRHRQINISENERWVSGLGGGALALYGLRHGGFGGILLALAGGSLIYRGVTGHCDIYHALGISTSEKGGLNASVRHGEGIKVEKSVTINKPPEELFRFWRNFENLPRVMSHLETVRVIDEKRSHWVASAPAGTTVEWDAEIINEKPNELIAWRSLEDSQIPNAGSVRFERAPNGRGTEVKVALNYEPPAGSLGSLVAKLFGEEPAQQVAEDLRHFKQVMEAGETPSVEGQPSGRSATSGRQK
ncbi:MAG TPA: SRPBCC family protein [Blastocatellia bacterium]|nr:SRPBCC family protein [Blastocatellia bacterium]